jgi:hypothetical protein
VHSLPKFPAPKMPNRPIFRRVKSMLICDTPNGSCKGEMSPLGFPKSEKRFQGIRMAFEKHLPFFSSKRSTFDSSSEWFIIEALS